MSWNQGGGPWGNQGGNQGGNNQGNPWGQRGGGGNGGPDGPDLDEMLRRSQERFRNAFGGGSPKGSGLLVALAVVAVIALQGMTQGHFLGFYRINDGEVAVVQRFGAVVRQEPPGLRWLVPLAEKYTAVSTSRINRVELGIPAQTGNNTLRSRDNSGDALTMLTGDSNIVDMQFTVQWRVSDAVKFLFNMRNPDVTLRVAAESVMREVMGQNPIWTSIGKGRDNISNEVDRRLRELINSYDMGISIVGETKSENGQTLNISGVQLQRMEAPVQVWDAFTKAQNADQEAKTLVNVAEGYRNSVLPKARAEANRMLEEARAYKSQVVAGAQGDADRFTQVYNAYKQAQTTTTTRLYLETMEQVLGGANKLVLDGGTASKAMPYLPLDTLRRAPAATTAAPAASTHNNSGNN